MHRQVDKDRQKSIQAHRQEVIKERELDLYIRGRKSKRRKNCFASKYQRGYSGNIGAGLCGQSEATWKKSLETQLRFRQHVLKQSTADKSLYYLSRNKRKLSSSELRANLGREAYLCLSTPIIG